jgi:hypothetical protein
MFDFLITKRDVIQVFLVILLGVICCNSSVKSFDADVLLAQLDARSRGMGEASCAIPDNTAAIVSNPAGLIGVQKLAIHASRANWQPNLWFADYRVYFASMAYSSEGSGTFAVSFTKFDQGEFSYTDATGQEIGTIGPWDVSMAVGYARSISPKIALGCNAKLIRTHYPNIGAGKEFGNMNGTGFGFDIGILYHGVAEHLTFTGNSGGASDRNKYVRENFRYRRAKGLSFGLCIQNIGSDIAYRETHWNVTIPRNLKMGFSYRLMDTDDFGMLMAMDINRSLFNLSKQNFDRFFDGIIYNLGTELNFFYMIDGRVGYIYDRVGQSKALTYGFSLGPEKYRFNISFIPGNADSPLAKTMFLGISVNL